MKRALIIHNPTAGEGDPSCDELIKAVQMAGFEYEYQSVKEQGWKERDYSGFDCIVIVGGDGTVRKTIARLRANNVLSRRLPIGLIPAGTANNIASALGLMSKDPLEIPYRWDFNKVLSYDLFGIANLKQDAYFIEGIGFGLFPALVESMADEPEKFYTEEKLEQAHKLLLEMIPTYPAKNCQIEVDGVEYFGDFFLVEIMNIPSIGPNLILARQGDPGDGLLDVVLVSEDQRDDFYSYVMGKLEGKEEHYEFTRIRAKKVQIFSEETTLHVDDKLIHLEDPLTLSVSIMKDSLCFFQI